MTGSLDARIDRGAGLAQLETIGTAPPPPGSHVAESRFGTWFIHTGVWSRYVLATALGNLEGLIPDRRASYPAILDLGCGWGLALPMLHDRFRPRRLVAIDVDARMTAAARAEATRLDLTVEFQTTIGSQLRLADRSIDLAFCHQTFHHVVDQEDTLREIYRVLKPGGVLLFAESTRRFIFSWIIRLLFRHPMNVQRTAAEYLRMIRRAGFTIAPESIAYPDLWWSRPDLGMRERWFGVAPRAGHEETLINLAAIKR